MMTSSPALVRRVLAPDGSVLTLADLPQPDAQRWVASRKAIVVAAVRGGLLSMSDACARYRLTTEEFLSWQTQVDRIGLKGLRATRVQEYRGTGRRKGFWDVRGGGTRSDVGGLPDGQIPGLSGRRSHSGYGLGSSNPDRVV